MDTRATLESTGEHLFAVAKLHELGVGDDYTVEQYLAVVELGREVGAGQKYASKCLGTEAAGNAEVGTDHMARASAVLRGRGINPAAASYEQLRDALVAAEPFGTEEPEEVVSAVGQIDWNEPAVTTLETSVSQRGLRIVGRPTRIEVQS
jgi:hypothetical protein